MKNNRTHIYIIRRLYIGWVCSIERKGGSRIVTASAINTKKVDGEYFHQPGDSKPKAVKLLLLFPRLFERAVVPCPCDPWWVP